MIRRAARPDTHFTILRNDVLRDKRLSYRARGLLAAILSRPDNWSIRADQLAIESKEGRGAVRTALQELRECGYLKTIVRKVEGGRFVTEQIVFDTPQEFADQDLDVIQPESESRTSADGTPVDRTSETRSPLEESRRRNEKKNREEETNNSSAIEIAGDRFDEFWAHYPKKKDKDDARRAWVKALRKAPADLLIERARLYAIARKGKDPQFTKHGATWLNKGAWMDEDDPEFTQRGNRRDEFDALFNEALGDVYGTDSLGYERKELES